MLYFSVIWDVDSRKLGLTNSVIINDCPLTNLKLRIINCQVSSCMFLLCYPLLSRGGIWLPFESLAIIRYIMVILGMIR